MDELVLAGALIEVRPQGQSVVMRSRLKAKFQTQAVWAHQRIFHISDFYKLQELKPFETRLTNLVEITSSSEVIEIQSTRICY